MQRANSQMLSNLLLLGISAMAALLLAWAFGEFFLLDPIKRLVAATHQLGRGEMDIRTGLHHSNDELGQLAQSFDDMAALLESKNLERQRAEEALSRANAELEQRVNERTAELSSLNAALTLEVHERKRAELQLTESRWHLQKAMDAAKLGVWRREQTSGELICDQRTKAIFGADPDVPGDSEQLLNRIVPEDREAFGHLFAEQDGDIDVEYRIASADSGVHWVRVRGSWMTGESGAATRVTGVVMDITEQKTAEQQMRSLEEQFRHSQKMEAVGRLAGGVAHDFNNLLLVINGHAELIAETAGLGDGVRRQLQAIHQAGQRAAQLTSHLLAFSRKQNIEPKTFELDQAITGVEKIIRCSFLVPENIRAGDEAQGREGVHQNRSRAVGADHHEPRAQRAGCHAFRRPADHRDGMRGMRPKSVAASRRPGCWQIRLAVGHRLPDTVWSRGCASEVSSHSLPPSHSAGNRAGTLHGLRYRAPEPRRGPCLQRAGEGLDFPYLSSVVRAGCRPTRGSSRGGDTQGSRDRAARRRQKCGAQSGAATPGRTGIHGLGRA